MDRIDDIMGRNRHRELEVFLTTFDGSQHLRLHGWLKRNDVLIKSENIVDQDDYFVVGIVKTGDLFVRYILNDKLFAICEYNYLHSSDDKISEHVVWGIGYSFPLFNNFYLEPNYTNGEEGSFNISISYKI